MFEDPLCEVGCPYAVRGFDFDYVGILWLSDLKWRQGRWVIDFSHVHERGITRRIKAAKKESSPDGPAHKEVLRAIERSISHYLNAPDEGYLYLV